MAANTTNHESNRGPEPQQRFILKRIILPFLPNFANSIDPVQKSLDILFLLLSCCSALFITLAKGEGITVRYV